MAAQVAFWVQAETETPLHEFLQVTQEELNDWLAGRISHQQMQDNVEKL